VHQEIIIGVERRRRWSIDQKVSILSEIGVGGAKVADVARRHDVRRQHIYQWRAELKRKGVWPCMDGGAFLALDPPTAVPVEQIPPVFDVPDVEIVLRNGRALRCPGTLGDAALSRLIRLMEAT